MKFVIFDMDGTLIDSKKDLSISLNYIRKSHYGLDPVSEDFVTDAINADNLNLAQLFYGTQTYLAKDKEVFEQHYAKQCTQHTYLYDGVKEVLEMLKANGIKLSVATNATTIFAQKMLEHLEIRELFDVVIGADKVKSPKPSPDMLYNILYSCGFDAKKDSAWMVGDSAKDMQSAKNANINSIFVTWGFSQKGLSYTKIENPKDILKQIL